MYVNVLERKKTTSSEGNGRLVITLFYNLPKVIAHIETSPVVDEVPLLVACLVFTVVAVIARFDNNFLFSGGLKDHNLSVPDLPFRTHEVLQIYSFKRKQDTVFSIVFT